MRIGPALLLLLGFTLLAWLPTLQLTDWTADDPQVVLEHPVVTGAHPASVAFAHDYTHHIGDSGQWRPASTLSLRADHALYGPDSSRGWHLSNLLLHLITVALAALLAYRTQAVLPLLGVAVYAVHPILSDSVAWVSGRPALLCALLGLSGAHLFQSALSRPRSRALITLSATLALCLPLMAKEDGVLFALLLLLLAAPKGAAAVRRTVIGCALALGLWFAARAAALGVAMPAAAHPVLAGAPLNERLLVGLQAAAESIRLGFVPWNVPPRYELESLPGVQISLLLLAAFGVFVFLAHRQRPIRASLIALPALALVPFLQLLPAGEVFAPRFLHIPLLFSIPLVDRLLRHLPRLLPPVFLLTLLPLTWVSISSYEDAESYWRASLRHAPSSPVAWNGLGTALADDGRHEEAMRSLRTSLEYDPGHSRTWSNLARSLYASGREMEAVDALRAAVRTGPRNPIAHINWGRHLARQGRHAEAREAFLEATRLRPHSAPAWDGLSRAEAGLGRASEAEAALQRAHSLRPD